MRSTSYSRPLIQTAQSGRFGQIRTRSPAGNSLEPMPEGRGTSHDNIPAGTEGGAASPATGKAAPTGLVEMEPATPDPHLRVHPTHESHAEHDLDGHNRRSDVHKKFIPAIRWMTLAEVTAYILVALTLLVMALVVVYRGGDDVFQVIRAYIEKKDATEPIIDALSNFLFVVILMELLATLITHIRHETFQVKPFLIIGIISGVRQILLLGARLSLKSTNMSGVEWRHSQIELGVNVGIDLILVICLVLLRRYQVESD